MGSPDGEFTLPVPHIPDAVDATGAGDVFAGTLAARLALGDSLPEAAGLGRRRRFALSGRTRRNGPHPGARRNEKHRAGSPGTPALTRPAPSA
jgi:2-dehydro-3-deoxygluconokinase